MKAILAQPITKSAASDFQRLLEDKQFLTLPKVGDIVKGRALSVSKTEVHLDIGGYASGVVRGRELYNESAEYGDLKIGDETEATVIELENELGELELSFRFAGQRKSWDNINTLKDDSSMVEVEVVEANKGGLLVRMGHVVGFCI
ncbi:MAG: 30S ribosomal protein S1 [Parcubacteria group bacterium GW2011_GWA2_46_9]|nr:MAG: 30S ribosomal protein S1 [Parcubacteria group bacterium GW2011_GWA2_46_9]